MRWLFFGLVVGHGLIHFMGFAKAIGLAELPQLTQPISSAAGTIWFVAGAVMVATGLLFASAPRLWWAVGLVAVLLSQVVIISSWNDAKFGTVANLLVLAGIVYGFASRGPLSFHAEYEHEVRQRLGRTTAPSAVTEGDLDSLPRPVKRYVRLSGAIGRPRVRHFRAEWRGRIRASTDDPWMEFTATQHNFLDEPARFFHMTAIRSGLPVDVFHAFREESAAMRVRLLSLLSIVDVDGPDLARAETVTLLNDLCLLVPGALVDPSIRWEPIDSSSARAEYTVGANTIGAVLSFNEAGELQDFVSDDRLAVSQDGTEFARLRWSTPVGGYRSFGPWHLMTRGEGRWHAPSGEFAYIELELLGLEVNGERWTPSR